MADFVIDEMPSSQVGVSNTEAQQAYRCEFAWLIGFHPEMNYQLRDMGEARTRGIVGHKALEVFFLGLKEGRDYDSCAQEALDYIQGERVQIISAGDFANMKLLGLLNQLHPLLTNYFEHARKKIEQWEILEVEAFHAMEWEGEKDFYLPSRLDVTVYWLKGSEFYGETSPLDHKFVDQFWNRNQFVLNSQLPLQMLALRASRFQGKPEPVVRRAVVNQLRTKKLKDPSPEDLFRVVPWDYKTPRIDRVFKNHLKTAVHLAFLKRLPLAEAMEIVRASLGSQACKFCDFKELCDITFEGGDPSSVIAATLKSNEYGYPSLEEIRRER